MVHVRKTAPADRQFLLFSATIPDWVKGVAEEYLKKDYAEVDMAKDLANKTSKTIKHLMCAAPFHKRLSVLADLLQVYGNQGQCIVFTTTKNEANTLSLEDSSLTLEKMHGDISQPQRERTLKRFREKKFNVLVATDVAARGLDIPSVELVVQIEPPKDVESYIHRSGRTARAGKKGTCITIYNDKTKYLIEIIESRTGIRLTEVQPPTRDEVRNAGRGGSGGSAVSA